MHGAWYKLILKISRHIQKNKYRIIKAGIFLSIFFAIYIIILEIFLGLISLPAYIKRTHFHNPILFNHDGFSYRLYRIRRRLAGLVTVLGVVYIGSLMLYASFIQAATITWDGGGADNNWSTGANWSTDSVPATGDDVVFDGTSTKDVTYDTGVGSNVINSVTISSGYTGTLTLAQNMQITADLSIADGAFVSATHTLDIDGDFTQSAGSFTASSATTSFAGDFRATGGTYVDAGGVISFDSTTADSLVDLNTSITFTDLYLNLTGSGNSLIFEDASDSAMVATGTLTLLDGQLETATGTTRIENSGTLDQRSTWDGGDGFVALTGSSRTVNLLADATMSHLEINGSGIDVQAAGTTSTLYALTIYDGTFTANSSNIVLSSTTTLNGASAVYTGGSGTETMPGVVLTNGTMNFGTGNTDITTSLYQSGGTFVATSATTSVTLDLRITGGTFTPSNGVLSLADSVDTLVYIDVDSTLNVDHFAFNKVGNKLVQFVDAADRIVVSGTLYLYGGRFNGGNGVIEATNGFVHESGYAGNAGTIEISGSAREVYLAADSAFSNLLLDSAGTTVHARGNATTSLNNLQVTAGTFQANSSSIDIAVHLQISGSSSVFEGGTGSLDVGISTFAQSGGIIRGGEGNFYNGSSASISGTLDFTSTTNAYFNGTTAGSYIDIGGTFIAPSGTMYVYGGLHPSIGTMRFISPASFDANGGTIEFIGPNPQQIINNANTDITFYNLRKQVYTTSSFYFSSSGNTTNIEGGLFLLGSPTGTLHIGSMLCSATCTVTTGTDAIVNYTGSSSSVQYATMSDLNNQGSIITVGTSVEDLGNVDGLTGLFDDTAPPAPGNLTLGTLNQTQIRLALGATSSDGNFGGYEIYYKEGASGVTQADTAFTSSSDSNLGDADYNSTTSTLITGLTLNTQYVFNIWAVDDYGNSSTAATELVLYSAVYAPANFAASLSNIKDVTLTWEHNGNSADVEYYVQDANDGGTNSGWITGTTYTFTDLNEATDYTFSVMAKNSDDVESASLTVNITTDSAGGGAGAGAGAGSGTGTAPPPPPPTEPPPTEPPPTEPPPTEPPPTEPISPGTPAVSEPEPSAPIAGGIAPAEPVEEIEEPPKKAVERVAEAIVLVTKPASTANKIIETVQKAAQEPRETAATIIKNTTEVVQAAEEIADDPEVEDFVQEVVAPVAAGVSVTTVAVSVGTNALALLRLLFFQPLLLLGVQRRKGWGVVYNSISKLPIDLAIVRLVDVKTNKLVQSRVTDIEGRYMFRPQPGLYRIEVSKQNFVFPSNTLKNVGEDGKRLDLYHGDTLEVKENGGLVTPNIPVDPADGKSHTPARIIRQKYYRTAQHAVALTGIATTGVSLYINPSWPIAGFMVLHVGLFGVFKKFALPKKPKRYGQIVDKTTGIPIHGAVVRLYTKEYNKLVDTKITNSLGDYAFLVGPSKYFITVQHPYYKLHTSATLEFEDIDKAFIVRDIRMEPMTDLDNNYYVYKEQEPLKCFKPEKVITYSKPNNLAEDIDFSSFKPDFGESEK